MSNIYQFANFATASRDVKQNITADTVIANNLEISTYIIDNLETNNISAISPNTQITINNDLDFDGHDIMNVGTLQAANIIGDITDDVIDVNIINPKDNPYILISGDINLDSNNLTTTGNIQGDVITNYISSIGGDIDISNNIDLNQNDIVDCDNITARRIFLPAQTQTQNTAFQLHIASTQNASIWLQADTNNITESDLAYLYLTEDNGSTMHYIGGGNNTLKFISGSTMGTQGIVWQNATVIPASGNTLPTYTDVSTGLNLTSTTFTISRNTNLSGNNLINVGLLDFQTQPTNDNTATRILVVDSANGNVKYRDVSSISNNPFDQSLNTTNDVKFNNIEVEGVATFPNVPLDATATNIALFDSSNNLVFNTINDIVFTPARAFTSSTAGSSTTLTTFQNKIDYTTPILPKGDYYISFEALATADTPNTNCCIMQFMLDSLVLNGVQIASAFNNLSAGYTPIYQRYRVGFTSATTHNVKLQYMSDGSSTAIIADARIFIEQISN